MTTAFRRRLFGAVACVALAAAANAQGPRPTGLRLEVGSVARHQIVSVGRDVEIEGEALAGVTAVNGSVVVGGRVAGAVTVLGGDLVLSSRAVLDGDALVLGGRLMASPGARIAGRAVAYPSVSRAWLTLLEGPSLGLAPGSPLVIAAKLGLVAAWLALTLVLFATSGRPLVRTSEEVALEPLRSFAAGLVFVSVLILTALLFSAWLPALLALPLLTLVVLLALMLKLWGMVAVFHAFGSFLAQRLNRRLLHLHAAVLGLLVLGVLKLVPYLGIWCWTAATLVGVGAALRSKFGRFEPWFELEGATLA